MKRIFLLLLSVASFVACAKPNAEITVSNMSNIQRKGELVQFCLCSVKKKLALKPTDKIVIIDKDGKQLPYQLINQNRDVIFPATVAAEGKSTYKVEVGTPISMPSKTFARKVPERKDDFAWENDRIAFRMYGPALLPENPSNGIDIWLKKTDKLIVDKFYHDDVNGKPYHVDYGEGIDCYKVGHTLGCGGVTPYTVNDSTLWVGSHYNSCKVIENGPLRSVFELTYDTLRIGKNTVKATLKITIDAGSQLNKGEVEYTRLKQPINIAMGIYLHDSIDNKFIDLDNGIIAYAEKATSDAGVPEGRMYEGVFVPGKTNAAIQQYNNLLMLAPYTSGEKFTYFFGAGWNQWGFHSDNDWFSYLKVFAQKIKNPLRVTVK